VLTGAGEKQGVIRWMGTASFAEGEWLGVELQEKVSY
jgi:dynactin complex subunit